MSKPAAALTILPPEKKGALAVPAAVSEDFAEARKHWTMAKNGYAAATYCALVTGLELLRLHKVYGVKRGGDRRSDQTRLESGLKWEALVQREMGFGDDWARRLMSIAAAAKAKVKALRGDDLLSLPLSELPAARMEAVRAAAKKFVGDAETIQELAVQVGVAKKRSGNASPTGGTADPATVPIEKQAQDAVWPFQLQIAEFLQQEDHAALLLALPLQPTGEAAASLEVLLVEIDKLRTAVRSAIAHHKKEAKSRR